MKLCGLLVSLAFLITGYSYAADSIQLNSASGKWTNAKSDNTTPSNFSGAGTNFIEWGNPVNSGNQSGYRFTGSAPPAMSVALDTPFAIGTFTHYNFPITGRALTSVDLGINALLNINGTLQPFSGTYSFLHNETPNFGPGCCNDIVSFENNVAQLGTFNIAGVAYTIGLLGFKTSPNGALVQQFSTVENKQNDAVLYAQISKPSVFAPEPSTYLLFGTLIGAAAFLVHRRRKATVLIDKK